MKRSFFLFFAILFTTIQTWGQTGLTYSNNAYLDADYQPFIITDNKLDEGPSGPQQTWDFSTLTQTGELVSYMISASEQPASVLFPEANIVIRENKFDYYFKVTPEGMDEYGNSCASFTVIYDKPIKKFPFPFTFGSSITGNYTGYIYGKPEVKVEGSYSTEADGYGTLILPGNITIHDVLRVKFVRNRDQREGATVCYRWYAQNSDPVLRYPLLSLTKYENGEKTNVYRVAYYALAYQLASNNPASGSKTILPDLSLIADKKYDFSVSPNPFTETAYLSYTLPENARVTIEAFDNLGRKVATIKDENQLQGKYKLPFEGNELFIYLIRFSVNGQGICSRKLIHLNR